MTPTVQFVPPPHLPDDEMTNRTVQSLLNAARERWGDCTVNLSLFAARWCLSVEVRGKVVEYLTADTLRDIYASLVEGT